MRVFIYGAGKVGKGLGDAARVAGHRVELRAARDGLPARRIRADLVIVAVRDGDVAKVARALVDRSLVAPGTPCVHVAGALTAEALAPLREARVPVAQMHPMVSFADRRLGPALAGKHVHVKGDSTAERRARAFVRSLGLVPRSFEPFDPIAYHAAAGLVANGAAALAAVGATLLERAGVPARTAPLMLGPLLASVAENIERLGFPTALTGPVRRGDAGAVARHGAVLEAKLPEARELYLAAAAAQLPLARAIGDAPPEAFDALQAWLDQARSRSKP